ncbi:MAG: FlgD immunoglobulin-like domain containing protein, partial [Bacteroidota bacterium]
NPTLNDTLQFKFVNGTWSPQGDNEGLDALNSLQGCRAGGFGNRAFVIQPGTFRYCYDRCDSVCLRIQTGLEEPFWAEAVTYPNPARSIAYTQLYLSNNKAVHAVIVDASGRIITTLHQGIMDAGQQILQWNGTDMNGTPVASGVYTLRLDMEEKVLFRKILWQP